MTERERNASELPPPSPWDSTQFRFRRRRRRGWDRFERDAILLQPLPWTAQDLAERPDDPFTDEQPNERIW